MNYVFAALVGVIVGVTGTVIYYENLSVDQMAGEAVVTGTERAIEFGRGLLEGDQ